MDTANGMVRMPKTNHSTLTDDVTIYQLLNHLATNQYMHDVAVKGKTEGWGPLIWEVPYLYDCAEQPHGKFGRERKDHWCASDWLFL